MIAPGTRVGRFEIESFLGAGGMGEVYVAHDTTLGRRVALKVLPRDCAAERIARFQREAHASSALNHPSIVSVHDAGTSDGIHYLAMELIEGESLAMRMSSRRSLAKSIELLAQVADGLACAHDAGIVHRDLKPANIMIGREGYAKVVDFGIAKLTERASSPDGPTEMKTASGSLLGTTSYMSPEQAEGREVDARSDIFSFGTVLYELLTGRHPFAGTDTVETMHNIAHRELPVDAVPAAFRRIVRRCLAKEPNERYQSMKDVAHELRDAAMESAPVPARRRAWVAPAIVALILVLAGMAWYANNRGRNRAPLPQPDATMARITNSGNVTTAAISPDGRFAVYSIHEGERQALWVKQLATGTATRITEPASISIQKTLVSPDANYVYYVASSSANANIGHIYQIPMLGGESRRVSADTEFEFTLSPDGKRIAFRRFNAQDRKLKITIGDVETSMEQVLLTRVSPALINALTWSPDSASIAFIGGASSASDRWIEEVAVKDGKTSIVRPIPLTSSDLVWMADGSGFLVCAADENQPPQVWLMPRAGSPRKLTSDVSAYSSITPTADARALVALRGEGTPSVSVLQWNKEGMATPVASGLGNDFNTSGMQPASVGAKYFILTSGIAWLDPTHLLYTGVVGGRQTILAVSTAGGEPRPLIRGMAASSPMITSDGKKVVFLSTRSGSSQVWVAGIDGSSPKQITEGNGALNPMPSPDGRYVYYATIGTGQFIWRVSIEGGRPTQLTTVPSSGPRISPDGKLILCRYRTVTPEGALWRTALLAAGTGKVVRLMTLPRLGGVVLGWNPSGRSFATIDGKGGVGNLWEENIDGSGVPRQITDFTRGVIYSFDFSRDGKSIALLHGEPRNDVVILRNFR